MPIEEQMCGNEGNWTRSTRRGSSASGQVNRRARGEPGGQNHDGSQAPGPPPSPDEPAGEGPEAG